MVGVAGLLIPYIKSALVESECSLQFRPDLLDVLLLEPGGSKFFNFRKKI